MWWIRQRALVIVCIEPSFKVFWWDLPKYLYDQQDNVDCKNTLMPNGKLWPQNDFYTNNISKI